MKKILLLGLLLFAFSAWFNVPRPALEPKVIQKSSNLPAYLETFTKTYERYFEDAMRSTNTPGAAMVIVKDSQIVFIRGFGPRFVGGADSINEQTVFRIGSLSKGFAAVLTGILVQDSLLGWNDYVLQYYPEFTLRDRKQAARIRLWHLLSHTTGLPYHAFTNLIEKDFSIGSIVSDYFAKAPVSGKEGVFYAYQNAAFCVIEAVMRQQTGKSYPQVLEEKIFDPLGMRKASCDFEQIQREPNKTFPHVSTGWGSWRADSISHLYYNASAAGGVNASIADMGAWLKLLLGQRPDIVADSTLDFVFHPVVKTDKERSIFPHWLKRDAAAYALGWRVLQDETDTIVYHGGYVNGYKSEIAFNRKDGIGICVLFNAPTALSNGCIPEFFEQWKAARLK